ncbi:MAG: hypothetical protein CVU33_19265 [Betaproteobacteria bacterium HGW-Betaproteobacteria-6]|jgi:hypothetical protein|nr:MAG: hypothetical protein CVU33_19265 [Betaproteobacteria bacterium HGW-Betaproteobacteria-6]
MFNLSYQHFANAYRRFERQDQDALFANLGWQEQAGAGGHVRNGAVLTSLALISVGAQLNGGLRILAGPLQGGRAFNGANRLAGWLGEHFGEPEIIALDKGLSDVAYQLFGRHGIVAFIQGSGPQGGSIGLLDGRNAASLCRQAEIHHPLEVRFWALN